MGFVGWVLGHDGRQCVGEGGGLSSCEQMRKSNGEEKDERLVSSHARTVSVAVHSGAARLAALNIGLLHLWSWPSSAFLCPYVGPFSWRYSVLTNG